MATLRELKNRLRGVRTTRQLAGAMRTVAAAKYSRAAEMIEGCEAYAAAAGELALLCGGAEERKRRDRRADPPTVREAPELLVLVSSNRGLCGGYNHELFSFFSEELERRSEPPLVIAVGRMAADYCREKHIGMLDSFVFADVPDFASARALAERLTALYEGGEVSSVGFIFRRFVNMLRSVPEKRRFLPLAEEEAPEEKSAEEPLFIPDRRTVSGTLRSLCLASEVHSILLSCASGAQAATLMAMRSAYDNAMNACAALETQINRRRQASVTQSVIETSADADNYSF
ncbi:MAG: F0F1 ATP synthase subunit gamma [Clostridia bacterium]|nr:F0F1 ATP synthase subunit gamma [Clostridia bacterium]